MFNKIISKIYKNFFLDEYKKWIVNNFIDRPNYRLFSLYKGIKGNKTDKINISNFRRNIHRIEKGLSSEILKDVFAEDYILETVFYLKENNNEKRFDESTLRWGESVLNEYFLVTKHTITIENAYSIYCQIRNSEDKDWIPYEELRRPQLKLSYDDLLNLAERRRSVRSYHDKVVVPELVYKAMKLASLSPSACNRQSFNFLFYNDSQIVNRLTEIPGGVSGYILPSVIVVIGTYSGYFDERDINAPLIDASLASMSLLFALETLGLSSVCINWPNLTEKETRIRQVIDIREDEFVVMMIGVGYSTSNGKIPYSGKKCIESLLSVNERIK